tara:strand:+ start:99 stop:317 length:219 start_codon:yes stop_codon:yes gene_type:complete
MAKDRSYGDRGTGFTPRNESVPGTKNEKKFGRGARWCKRCGCYTSCIQKYDLSLCRQCFREVANSLGFKKLR